MCKKSATKIFTINRNILFKLIGRFYIVQSYTFLNIQNDIIRLHVFLIYEFIYYKVTTKKRNAERYSDRIELQGFQSCFRLFVKPSQSPLKPNQDAATLLVRNHARNGDKRTRITKQGVKD